MATIKRTMGWFRNLTTKALYGQTDEELRARYEIDAQSMFQCRILQEMPEVDLVEMIVEIAINPEGRLGVIVARGYHSCAVHEINRNQTFSNRLPYWTRKDWRCCHPRRFARCLFVRAKRSGNPMKPNSEQILHVGHAILELDTELRPYLPFDHWKLRSAREA